MTDGGGAAGNADYRVFQHLSAPGVDLYRSILAAFVEAKDRFRVHLRPDDLRIQSPNGGCLDDDRRLSALESLVEWGNLVASPDTARVTVVADF